MHRSKNYRLFDHLVGGLLQGRRNFEAEHFRSLRWMTSSNLVGACPGKDKESNWLPAPNAPFSLYMRAYWADKKIIDGQWKPPVVSRVQ